MTEKIKILFPDPVKKTIRKGIGRIRSTGKQKIFGIGNNKTGTTSLKVAMQELGFVVGNQRTAEELVQDWARRDFRRIINYCKTAQFFQDVPFSKPFTYIVMDHAFPGSKFILTVRDSPEQWYNSLIQFHAEKWGRNGNVPTKGDLQDATYIYKGWPWKSFRLTYDTPDEDPYNKDILIQHYQDQNKSVMEYFRHRPDDLLVLNVAETGAYLKLCDFLGVDPKRETFPWKNKTRVQS